MDAEEALQRFDHIIEHECPVMTCAAAPGTLCDTPALWVHLERIQIAGQTPTLVGYAAAAKPVEDRMGILRGYAVSHTQQDSTVLIRRSDEEWVKYWRLFEPAPTLADIASAAFADHLAQKGH